MNKKNTIITCICMLAIITLALVLVVMVNEEALSKRKNEQVRNNYDTSYSGQVIAEDGRVIGTSLQAFLNDDEFFDKDKPEIKEIEVVPEEEMEFVESEELISIDFLIHTADEINELEEDALAKNRSLNVDSDETENDSLMVGNSIALGIDVSGWNGDIDWEKVKNQGVRFAIIRCGYRGYGSGWLVEDSYFQKNLKGAIDAGLEVGIYFFTQAIDENEAIEEAKTAISLLGNTKISYPVFIDTEGSGSNGNGRADSLDRTTRTKVCQAFCRTVEEYGYKAGIYASCNWYNNNLSFDAINQYVIWLAEYRNTPNFTEYYDMWQYTSRGKIDGINGNVDLNIQNGTF